MEGLNYTDDNVHKKKHPIERGNKITNLFFCWLLPYFVKGYKRELTEDDMYGPLKSHESSRLGDKLQIAWDYEVTHKKNPSLLMALIKVFKFQLLIHGAYFAIMELVVKLSVPFTITKFLKYYEPNQTEMTKNEACIYAGLLILAQFLVVVCGHNYILHSLHLGMKIRVAVCSVIYRKALRLSKSALAVTTIGQMVNLLSNDVGRFDLATVNIHFLWMTPIQIGIIMYLVYIYAGPTGLVGTVFLISFIPLSIFMGKKTSQYRLRTALRTDERVRLMSEIVNGIQVIKMYTWEKPFAKLVELSRRKEMQQIRSTSVIRALIMSCNLALNRIAVYLCILTYAMTGNIVNASYAYTITSFYGMMQQVVTNAFPKAVTEFAEAFVSAKRINVFLLYDEMSLNNAIEGVADFKEAKLYQNNFLNIEKKISKNEVGIHLKNVSTKWVTSLTENTLESVTFEAKTGQLVAVVGQVGGGKSTLLHVILKELPPVEGTVDVQGTVSYASQEPWLFGGSVRQNIIFGQDFNENKYKEVIRVCALERDLSLFPYGDRTLVGDRGATLSGGQRARINLARAVYKDADIYLLDDPLSAVDTHVGKQLFDECICGYLNAKCVVLVTHQLQYLKNVPNIYLMRDGKVEMSGSYVKLQESDSEFTKLLSGGQDEEDENSDRKSRQIKDKIDGGEADQEAPVLEKEQRGSGVISWNVYKSYLRGGGSWWKLLLLFWLLIISQISASMADYFVNIWVNLEQWRYNNNNISTRNDTFTEPYANNSTQSLQDLLNSVLTRESSIIIYSFLVIMTLVITIARTLYFFGYCLSASTTLHNMMFNKIVYATMRFFNSNPPGRILNRFSKDIGVLDESLPFTIIDTVQIGLMVLAISIIIGSLNPWIFLPTLIILVIFYLLRIVFLRTSRDLKRMEAVTRSPIYTHLSASLQGLTTIRAFGAQDILKNEFDHYQNQYSASYFMFLSANRTFGFWLDFHCVIYTALITISILFVENEIFGGNVGLALTQSVSLNGMFQWGVRQWSELENNMTSVERVQEYIDVIPEKDENTKEPPKNWPEEGNIKFDNMCLSYAPEEPYVLKNLTFEIKAKEKVGIVGRTGAGKSSLISALFRLTDIDGRILIDGVDTKRLPLAILRSKISIIPQEPVLFSGTLRKNLDPFDEYNDDVLWSALTEVELKNAVFDLPAGLDSKMSEGGSNFSMGQRQLLCLARAIIRNNKVLVLDEATANVDPQTDSIIQTTIRRKFSDCTVLTIAHRLHTVMDSDKVLVMDAGRSVEFDHPRNLLLNQNGVFYGLVMQTGRSVARNLRAIAEENYNNVSL